MQDLSPIERRLFDWLSQRSDFTLASLPIAVFLLIWLLGFAAISTISGRFPFVDPYVNWVITAGTIAGAALYVTTVYAMAAVFIRSRRFRLLELHQTMRDIQAMSWREFEDLVAAVYLAQGYDVELRGDDRPDGGVDVVVKKGNLTWFVQCKHYRDQWVGERPIRELLGVVSAKGAAGGVLVACGVFDERALAFAKGNEKLELIGGEHLRDLIASAVRSRTPGTKCPKCGSPMRGKSGRFGAFLGCSNFPACHGWLPIRSGVKPD
jgi:HJR/Mrr/RecB family endonuclease